MSHKTNGNIFLFEASKMPNLSIVVLYVTLTRQIISNHSYCLARDSTGPRFRIIFQSG